MSTLDARSRYAITCLGNCPNGNLDTWINADPLAQIIAGTIIAANDLGDQVTRLETLRANLEAAGAAIPTVTPIGRDAAHSIALCAVVPLLQLPRTDKGWQPERDGAVDYLLAKLREDEFTDVAKARGIVADAVANVRQVIRALAAA